MSERLLFLPHCLNKDCSKKLIKEGGERGYKVYIVPGSSMVEKILSKYDNIDKIVGIACGKELELAMEYTSHLSVKGVKIEKVKLSKDGCKNTEVNLEEVLKIL